MNRGFLLCTAVYRCVPLCTAVYRGVPLCTADNPNPSTVEKYDTTKDAWTMLSMLGTPRRWVIM